MSIDNQKTIVIDNGDDNICDYLTTNDWRKATVRAGRAGSRLHTHHQLDHDALFRVAASVAGDVLMTYEDAPEVRTLAERHGLEWRLVSMKNTHHAEMTELLIGRDLRWVDG